MDQKTENEQPDPQEQLEPEADKIELDDDWNVEFDQMAAADRADIEAALKELEAEEKAEPAPAAAPEPEQAPEAQGEGKPAAEAQPEPAPEPEQTADKGEGQTIPKGRFDQVNERARAAEQRADQMAEHVATLSASVERLLAQQNKAAEQQQPKQLTPAEAIERLTAYRTKLREQFNEGEISADEYNQKSDQVADRLVAARVAQVVPRLQPQQQQQPQANDLYMADQTAQLSAASVIPVMEEKLGVAATEGALRGFQKEQLEEWKGQNVTYDDNNPQHVLALRKAVAQKANAKYGELLGWTGPDTQPGAGDGQAEPKAEAEPTVQHTGVTAEQRQKKQAAAAAQPPDPGRAGGSTAGMENQISEATFANMSSNELEQAVREGRFKPEDLDRFVNQGP